MINVLPYPLLKVMDDIHVSWQALEKPAPSDLSALLSVRRCVVERALVWLKKNNPLYANIYIDTAEMERWGEPLHGVPSQVYDRLERNEPSAREKIQTAYIVPPSERGLEDQAPVDIYELLASLDGDDALRGDAVADDPACAEGGADEQGGDTDRVHEISSSGMFGLDCRLDIADAEKLRYLYEAIGETDP